MFSWIEFSKSEKSFTVYTSLLPKFYHKRQEGATFGTSASCPRTAAQRRKRARKGDSSDMRREPDWVAIITSLLAIIICAISVALEIVKRAR